MRDQFLSKAILHTIFRIRSADKLSIREKQKNHACGLRHFVYKYGKSVALIIAAAALRGGDMSVLESLDRSAALTTARRQLAAAYRIAALEGLDDGIWNHFSAAAPGRDDQFLLKPHGLLFSEVTASNLIIVDLNGKMVEGEGQWEPTAFYIHSRMHAGVPSAKCVFHTHMPYATAVACTLGNKLLPVTQNSMRFYGRVASFNDYNGLALGAAEADAMVAALQDRSVLLMASHGVIVTSPTIADAVYNLHYLEMACRDQVLALQAAGEERNLRLIPDDIAGKTFQQINRNRLADAEVHLRAMMRRLDEVSPGYSN
jgi:ribulose-5-phosphate 4-epimerase/fuculose-1-phosphate aldolase